VLDAREIDWTIGWMVMSGCLFLAASKVRPHAAFPYFAAVNFVAAYYLALHKLDAGAIEWWTAPVAAGAMAWGALVLRAERPVAATVESLALGLRVVPSAVASFAAAAWHTWPAYGLALLAVVGGMLFRRKV
jgi:hypothetical protein